MTGYEAVQLRLMVINCRDKAKARSAGEREAFIVANRSERGLCKRQLKSKRQKRLWAANVLAPPKADCEPKKICKRVSDIDGEGCDLRGWWPGIDCF